MIVLTVLLRPEELGSTKVAQDASPGWVYDVDSGMPMGPASYELAEKFATQKGRPLIIMIHGEEKHRVVVKPKLRD